MKTKKVILTILLLCWMGVIFAFSNQDGEKSQSVSDGVTEVVVDKTAEITKVEITPEKKKKIIEDSRFIIRKVAHFTLYLILGIICYFTIKSYGFSKVLIITLLICLLFAISDEFHQSFMVDRCSKVYDIFIDFCGSFVSTIFVHFILDVKRKLMRSKRLHFD